MNQSTNSAHRLDPPGPGAPRGVADRIADAAEELFGLPLPVGLRAWDGSRAGSAEGPAVVIRSPRVFRQLLRRPGELGLARAYIAGELDVEGDLAQGLRQAWAFVRRVRRSGWRPTTHWTAFVSLAVHLGGIGMLPSPPPDEARPAGRLHSAQRDRSAVAHHYDLGNEFYASILDASMAYSCAYWTSDEPGYGLADAQRDKLDLICRKLHLRPGSRLLDVGCGWGSLILHAAQYHGVAATGVTISARQHEFVQARIAELGLADRVRVLLQDYREISEAPFDAVASIEMGEHVGDRNYPTYCAALHRFARPGGRVLLQQMSRESTAPGGGAFIENYIAPDMTMRPLNRTLGFLEAAGLEVLSVESMREHYVRTIAAWAGELERRWDEIVDRYGTRHARVWRLYLTGGALAFEENRMGVHQILAACPRLDGAATAPATAAAALPTSAGVAK
jgi:cyclopropane-fatty-acyl-phospholipid synthase